MARTVLAVFAGYVIMASLLIGAQVAVVAMFGVAATLSLSPGCLAANLIFSLLCGGVGGWVAAGMARHMGAPSSLAVLTLVLGAGCFLLFGGPGPAWFSLLLPAMGAAGCWSGGASQRGIIPAACRWPGRKAASGRSRWISAA
jgi:hypothetical protein